jgi:hypothetical protein
MASGGRKIATTPDRSGKCARPVTTGRGTLAPGSGYPRAPRGMDVEHRDILIPAGITGQSLCPALRQRVGTVTGGQEWMG